MDKFGKVRTEGTQRQSCEMSEGVRGPSDSLILLSWGLCWEFRFLCFFLWMVEIPWILGSYILNVDGGLWES